MRSIITSNRQHRTLQCWTIAMLATILLCLSCRTTAYCLVSKFPRPTTTMMSSHSMRYSGGGNDKPLFYQQTGDLTAVDLSFPFLPSTTSSTTTATTPSSSSSNFSTREIDHSVNNRHSASDWWHNILTLPRSTILKEIRHPVSVVAIWSQVVAVAHRVLSTNPSTQYLARNMCIGHLSHSLLTSSLGLLLVFRTNSAYQRFAEGRKIWEQILSVSRNFSRMMNIYDKEIGRTRKRRLQKLLAAFPYLLRHHVRPCCFTREDIVNDLVAVPPEHLIRLDERPLPLDTRFEEDKRCAANSKVFDHCYVDRRTAPWSLLPNGTLEPCARASNRPLWVCDRLAKEVSEISYSSTFTSRERLAMLSTVEKLSNAVGQCERIHHTAVPLNYARHALRSLTLWLFSLPFALIGDIGLLTGPVMGAISWLLLGVYQIGHSIEDPFQGTLRLSELCEAIRNDVLEDGGDDVRNTAFRLDDDETLSPVLVSEPDLVESVLKR